MICGFPNCGWLCCGGLDVAVDGVALDPFGCTPARRASANLGVMANESASDDRRLERGGAGTRKAPCDGMEEE